jgi:hypothetical protein
MSACGRGLSACKHAAYEAGFIAQTSRNNNARGPNGTAGTFVTQLNLPVKVSSMVRPVPGARRDR